jgi:phage terminase small subunit
MPGPLKNARHERFAQGLAKGETADAAYQAAGFTPNRGNATRLKANESVAARVLELQGKAAEKAVITIEGLTDRLLKIAKKGEEKEDASMLQVARASLMDAAKLNGLIIDRSKVGFDLSGLTDEELAQLEKLHARITKP